MSKWYQGNANNSDVVISSKINLSRNFADIPFPNRMSNEQHKAVNKRVFATIKNSQLGKEFDLINLSAVTSAKAHSYAEKQLINSDFISSRENNSFLLSKNEDISISMCDENHISISVFAAGQDLETAYKKADEIDDIFIKSYKIAFSDRLGFLTSSPVNIGTGLCASFVLHLQGLAGKGAIASLSSMVSKLGVSLQELYPNGAGAFYVLSNQVTLGITEKGAIDNLNAICTQIIKQERNARENLKQSSDFEDKIYRTLGILKLARKLNTEEFLNSISLIRLGISLGYFDYSYELIGDMLYGLLDASLVSDSSIELTKSMCEALRAEKVREDLE